MRFCAKKSFDPRVKAFLSSVCRCPLPFFPNLRINALPAAVMRCVRNFDYPFAAADKFFYQKRRNNLVVAADIMSLRNFRELFPITFQIKRFIQRRNFLVLCPGQMVEVAGNGYDFLNVEARFGGGNKAPPEKPIRMIGELPAICRTASYSALMISGAKRAVVQ